MQGDCVHTDHSRLLTLVNSLVCGLPVLLRVMTGAQFKRIRLRGLLSDEIVRDQLPRILAYSDHKRMLEMTDVDVSLSRDPAN